MEIEIIFLLIIIGLSGCVDNEDDPNNQQERGILMEWIRESGVRIDDGVSSATIVIDYEYVMYYTGESIQIAKSFDGLTYEKVGVVVKNEDLGSMQEMVTNPAIIELNNGSFRMIYEGSRWEQAIDKSTQEYKPGQTDRRLFSAFSTDGFTWTKEEGVRFQDYGDGKPNELFTSVPDIIRLDSGDLRMYYTRGITSATALSQDEGLSWTKEGNMDLGRIVIDPDIIRFDDGNYKLFFASFDSQFGVGDQYIMSASSSDGLTFTVDSGKRLEPISENNNLLDPDIILLPDGSYRMYYSEMQNNGPVQIKSAISREY